MRVFVILFTIFSPIFARPDVSLGYTYERGGGDNFVGSPPFQTNQIETSSTGGINTFSQTSQNNLNTFGIGVKSTAGFTNYENAGERTNFGIIQQQQQPNLEPLITKHFYIHTAPEETESQQEVRTVQIGRPQKTYRVVFIKAPAANQGSASIKPIYPKSEEKTVIYVLTQKADDISIGDIATPAPTHPSKPEVFFIKYKTAEEAAQAQKTIQAQYDRLGGTSKVSDEGVAQVQSVIGSLQSSSSATASTSSISASDIRSGTAITTGVVPNRGGTYLPPTQNGY